MRRSITLPRFLFLLLLVSISLAPFRTAAAPAALPAPAPSLEPPLAQVTQATPFVSIDSPPPPLPAPPPPSLPASADLITDTSPPATITPALGNLPLAFVPNVGQTRDKRVEYQTHYAGSTVYFRPDSVVLMLARRIPLEQKGNTVPAFQGKKKGDEAITFVGDPVTFQLDRANQKPQIRAVEPLASVVNYYSGSDPTDWHEGVSTFSQLIY